MPSSSPVIPKEQLSAYQRWEIGSLADDRNGGGSVPEREASLAQQQAQSAGYAEGYSKGMQQAANERARLQQLLQALVSLKLHNEQALADDLLELALSVARQVVGDALTVKREMIIPIIRAAISYLPQATAQGVVALNPADIELVRAFLPDEVMQYGLKLVPDSKIERGGCRIDTHECQVDATLATRWKNVLESLSRDHGWLT